MGTLATRLEKIEAQTDDVTKYGRIMGAAIRGLVYGESNAAENLRIARDPLAAIASQYDTSAQYWLNAAAVMLGEVEAPNFQNDKDKTMDQMDYDAESNARILAGDKSKWTATDYERLIKAHHMHIDVLQSAGLSAEDAQALREGREISAAGEQIIAAYEITSQSTGGRPMN